MSAPQQQQATYVQDEVEQQVWPHAKVLVILWIWILFLWQRYLAHRRWLRLKDTRFSVPTILKCHVSEKEYQKAKLYQMEYSNYSFVLSVFAVLETTIILTWDILPACLKVSQMLLSHFGYYPDSIWVQSILFGIIYRLAVMTLALPFSFYKTFVIEQRHGFNRRTLWLFLIDTLKNILLKIGQAVIVAGSRDLIEVFTNPYLLFAGVFLYVVGSIVEAEFIQPLFNTFKPLENERLREKIERLASSVKFPVRKIFVVDASKRSAHSNAYFYGSFLSKHIVLFDTLLEQANDDETLAIFAHELGHWKQGHDYTSFGISIILFVAIVIIYSLFVIPPIYNAFGCPKTHPIVGLEVFIIIFLSLMAPLYRSIINMISRMEEFQADRYAAKLGFGPDLMSVLITMNKKSLSDLNPDPLYSAWFYTHPTLVERLVALQKLEKEARNFP